MSARAPGSSYRLQLHRGFPLARAAEELDYLAGLGIRTLYLSPVLEARRGSSHGYDSTDPTRVWGDLGSPDALEGLHRAAEARGMAILLDVVTNHMFAGVENPWWADVLRLGPSSRYAEYFDIRWIGGPDLPPGKVFLPLLEHPLEESLAAGALSVEEEDGHLRLRYPGGWLPLSPASLGQLRPAPGSGRVAPAPLDGILEALSRSREDPGEASRHEERLRELLLQDPSARGWLGETLRELSFPSHRARLLALLEEQCYLLGSWEEAHRRVNYRRFFQVNDLVGVRVEDPRVFRATHQRILSWLRDGTVQGVRIDHIDGLREPREYLERLAREGAPDPGKGDSRVPYVLVEKILLGKETLPRDWPVHGTTGYDFLASLPNALVDGDGLEALSGVYGRYLGERLDFPEIAHEEKRRALREFFPAAFERLFLSLHRLVGPWPELSRLAPEELRRLFAELVVNLHRYRTYVRAPPASPEDRETLLRAAREAARRNPTLPRDAFEELARLLLLESSPDEASRNFVLDLQQFTGGVMAKGIEDATLYRYHRLLALNEVGSDPAPLGTAPERFHEHQLRTLRAFPLTMTTTSTHDTKRSEDVRARLYVLTELAPEWERVARQLREQSAPLRPPLLSPPHPVANQEYHLWQTLIGAWPLSEDLEDFPERLQRYLVKMLREAGVSSSWTHPNLEYEGAFASWADRLVRGTEGAPFRASLGPFLERVAYHGAWNSLAQVLLRTTAPGVPDLYQGCELFDFSLVDPDNRRPVDFPRRRRSLASFPPVDGPFEPSFFGELRATWREGRIKQFILRQSLHARLADPELYTEGEYHPLDASPRATGEVVAFLRTRAERASLTVVPRLTTQWGAPGGRAFELRPGVEAVLELPPDSPQRWRNQLTGERVELASGEPRPRLGVSSLLRELPVALLVGER
jgi:(1->4)-alpha-D-glucan 1-alpha-D-glucosylmutase